MNSPQVGPTEVPFLDRWSPAPHHRLASAAANGTRLHLSDGPYLNDPHRAVDDPSLRPPTQHTPPFHFATSWSHHNASLFFLPSQSYQPLPTELEPYGLPQCYSTFTEATGSGDYEDDSFDVSALRDQYLDLSERCPLPSVESHSVSPSADCIDSSEILGLDFQAAKRRRVEDWHFLRPPNRSGSDDKYSEESGDQEGPSRSPFYYSPPPGHELAPLIDVPMFKHIGSKNAHTTHLSGSPALKFTEARKDGRSKRQAFACLSCRERKIACGRPTEESKDRTCDQCVRRHRQCVYPTESRRGYHLRIKSLGHRARPAHNLDMGMTRPLLN
ncbi:hypothetical protein MVEN_00071400 [Mycena venus]|uniref:Zn(2)-C6 fungal-type domain-containing protein n=1 Tax=Mycena venus TaxID=2733690 RepID=A0A8H6ZAF8_9AGAR|nr:hypothetical protein MVEN_00071400 [Mycena venus]